MHDKAIKALPITKVSMHKSTIVQLQSTKKTPTSKKKWNSMEIRSVHLYWKAGKPARKVLQMKNKPVHLSLKAGETASYLGICSF